jgi:hypothetical protein
MGQRLLLALFLLLACCWSSFNEFGRVVSINGTILVSRNTDLFTPIAATRVYIDDCLVTSENSSVTLRTSDSYLTIAPQSKLHILADRLETEYGSYTSEKIPDDKYAQKSLPTALGLTALFPGSGHWYIQDYPKALPMDIATTYLLWNIFTINPSTSETYHDFLYTQKQQYQQIYLVYLIAALLDVYSGTKAYNKKIMEDDLAQTTAVSYAF